MPFTDTNVSKSSQFWLDDRASRARLADGNTLNVYSANVREASKIILDVFGDGLHHDLRGWLSATEQ